ncbi:gliding motility-associated C-terminal domain-containing protein [Mucilaginibacter gossypiicola]|uniref:Gliding motility-associated C-terminal domain-containing protein n=1 Tax=Mucilaginibacter gossypiicola TaxID=551995 RepID=A0A1H8MUS0_9SPHI|nr:gliding motility-associated C-terminal domain-containing protein [Mucilaginibacter gossypiicola]SEO20994.1 gliding motility-associated C-terminal domain-containing protein [Mucilaginibacter gossypiicola]
MPFNTIKLFLVVLFAFACVQVKAQSVVCNGSLGDPVFKLDFGSGQGYGAPLGSAITDFTYVQACPEDGQYTIVNTTNINVNNGFGNCHPEGWQVVTHDHTGNTNGYMMLVNASQDPKKFFTYKISAGTLCQNTKYEFSAWVFNLIFQAHAGPGVHEPDITFIITNANGEKTTYDTGEIPASSDPEDWRRYGMLFSTGSGNNEITIEMINNAPGLNGNDLMLDDIEFRPCGPTMPVGFTNVDDNATKDVCFGESKNFTLVSNVGNDYTDTRLQWQKQNATGTWEDLPGKTDRQLDVSIQGNTPVGVYEYRLAAAEGNNINSPTCRTYSQALTINVDAYLDKPSISAPPVCEGDALTLTANAPGAVSYEWTGPGVTADNKAQNPLVIDNATVAANGDYQVKVFSAGDCSTPSDKVRATVNLKPVIPVITPAPICKGSITILNETTPNAKSYSWLPVTGLSDPTSGSPAAKPAETTTYTVTVTSNEGCIATQTVTVTVKPAPEVSINPQKKIFEGQSVVLDAQASNADTYLWSPADGLDDPTKQNPVASPTDDITYTLKATSGIGCGSAFTSVFVRVYKKIVIPTTFSPNGDGLNDNWDIEALSTYPQCSLNVFNRNGQKVYASTGYDKPWNGAYKGYVLPSGTYYYVIDLKSGAPLLSGWVLIVH